MINGHGGNFFFFSLLRSESHYIRAGRMWKHRKYTRKVHRKLRTEQLMRSSVLLFAFLFQINTVLRVFLCCMCFFSLQLCVFVCVFGVVVRDLLWRLTQRSCRKRKIGVSLLFRVFGRVIRGEYK